MAPKPLLITCWMPGPPPMKIQAARMLVTKKPIATGTPNIIRPSAVPKRSVATQYQAMCLGGDVRQRREEVLAAPQEARELDRHHQERERNPADDHPARHVKHTHFLLFADEVTDRHSEAVPRDHQAHRDAGEADQAREPAPG